MTDIPTGSKVILRHNDGSKIVARKTPTGYESGHLGYPEKPGYVDDDWISRYGWHVESFEAPLAPLPTAHNAIVVFADDVFCGPKHLAWLAGGTWDMVLSKGEFVLESEDPVATIEAHGYDRPTSFTEYVPRED